MVVLNVLLLLAGFVALVKGADWFVDGAAGMAKRLKVPELIIGLTIVALGTSMPELAVSSFAALQKSSEIALSNVTGSNIFNILCVLGVCALLHPVSVDRDVIRRDFPLSIGVTVFVLLVAGVTALSGGSLKGAGMQDVVGKIARPVGAALLVGIACYIFVLVRKAKKHPTPEAAEGEVAPAKKLALLLLVGLALIIAGGEAVVAGAKAVARAAGMTETLIGLTIVAAGTSLPELVTSVVAAKKGQTDLALGNALGSNLFNMMLILGVSALIRPTSVNLASLIDLAILLGISIVAFAFSLTSKKITRSEGAVLISLYVADVVFAVLR